MSSDSDSDSDRYSSIKQEKRSPSPIPRRSLKGKTSQNNTINISRNEKDDPNASLIREGGFQNRPSIEDYLAKRTALIIDDTSRKESPLYVEDLLDDCDEEEVWMIQCPRDINIEKLVGTKLNLNGARHKAKKEKVPLEYESEIINNERFVTVMCKSRERRPSHRLVSLKPTGLIRVQAKLEEPCDPDIQPAKAPRVPYPSNLKIRHPLHGIHYAKRTELAADVLLKLKSAVKASNVAKNEIIVKTEQSPIYDDMEDSFNEMMGIKEEDPSPAKKAKKRKAPKEEPIEVGGEDEAEEDRPRKAKRSKKIRTDEIGEVNLDWLTAI